MDKGDIVGVDLFSSIHCSNGYFHQSYIRHTDPIHSFNFQNVIKLGFSMISVYIRT